MIEKRNILTFTLYIILLMGLSRVAVPEMSVYPKNIGIAFEYDDNVTHERLREDYQYGIISRLTTGFGIKNFIPVKGFDSRAEYDLRMRDVNTTNDGDYSYQKIYLLSSANLKTGTSISLKENFRLWNSQNDLFNFYDNDVRICISQPLGKTTEAYLLYVNRQKRFQNKASEVQARNYSHNQIGMDVAHKLSDAFTTQVGYAYGDIMYNRSPIDFKGDLPIALDGVQRDRQNIITLRLLGIFLDNRVSLDLWDQVIKSDSNSRAFSFNGNRAWLILQIVPFENLSVDLTYRIVAYNVEAYQTPKSGYELSEARSDDQGGIRLRVTYGISPQVDLQVVYERIENTVFFTREFYEKNTFSTGLSVKF